MDKFEKLAREAIKESDSISYTPQDPFVSFGFKENPFLEVTLMDLEEEKFIEPRFKQVIRYINKVHNSFTNSLQKSRKGNESVIMDGVLFGSIQSGISTLVSLSYKYIKKTSKKLGNTVYADAQELVEFVDQQYAIAKSIQNFRNFVGESDSREEPLSLILIDHADYLVEFFEDFRYAMDRDFQNTPIVFIFSHSGWIRLKNSLAYSNYDLYNHIVPSERINSLTKEEILEVLVLKLSINKQIQQPFSAEILSLIAEISSGSILNAIKICSRVCEDCHYNGIDIASKSLVDDVNSFLDIDLNKGFYDLVTLNDNTQTFILALTAMKSIAYNHGITYDDIINNLGIQKTSTSHHLKQLQEKRYLQKKTINRKAHYRLREELRTAADTHLITRFEQKETHVKLENIIDLI
ncbi:MAG: helix-turn-helix transcriptional regulator [Candidatus Heimdallarchaeota archaeon]|nr:helix-turn-helix transcriptional regulator [Candidatus Heimdallarchaeota archaeon]